MTTVARLAVFAGLMLRATADALDAFARSVVMQQERVPDCIPDWVDDGSAQL